MQKVVATPAGTVTVDLTPEEVTAHKECQEQVQKDVSRERIIAELDAIDRASIRALRTGETERLADLEARAVELRENMKTL